MGSDGVGRRYVYLKCCIISPFLWVILQKPDIENWFKAWNWLFLNPYLNRSELLGFLQTIPHLSSTHFSIDFESTSSRIVVRPVNSISKIISLAGFYKFLMIITLIYPIIWLIRYLILGVEYDVIRVAYPLVYWEDNRRMDQPIRSSQDQTRVLRGQTDRSWFYSNQQKIASLCQSGKIGPVTEDLTSWESPPTLAVTMGACPAAMAPLPSLLSVSSVKLFLSHICNKLFASFGIWFALLQMELQCNALRQKSNKLYLFLPFVYVMFSY